MALSIITLAKVLVASAAGYATVRWLSTQRNGGAGALPALQPAAPVAAHTSNLSSPPAEDSWAPREGGHPGRETMEYGAADRPRG